MIGGTKVVTFCYRVSQNSWPISWYHLYHQQATNNGYIKGVWPLEFLFPKCPHSIDLGSRSRAAVGSSTALCATIIIFPACHKSRPPCCNRNRPAAIETALLQNETALTEIEILSSEPKTEKGYISLGMSKRISFLS